MEVFVRVAAGREEAGLASLADIERKGGRPSLLVSGMPASLPESVAGHVRRIVVTGPSRPIEQSDEVFAFALKTSLTTLRAAVSATTSIGLSRKQRSGGYCCPVISRRTSTSLFSVIRRRWTPQE